MKDSQYYGGSMQECRDGRECYRLREKALTNGFHIERRKPGVITVVIHDDHHDQNPEAEREVSDGR